MLRFSAAAAAAAAVAERNGHRHIHSLCAVSQRLTGIRNASIPSEVPIYGSSPLSVPAPAQPRPRPKLSKRWRCSLSRKRHDYQHDYHPGQQRRGHHFLANGAECSGSHEYNWIHNEKWSGGHRRCSTRINLRKVQDLHPELGELRFVSKLGRGGFGTATLVRQRSTGILYSVKVSQPRGRAESNFKPRDLALEDRVALRHPFIVRMLKSFTIEGMKVSLFDFVRGPELRHLLDSVPIIIKENAPFYLAQIVLALEYLATQKVVHRDLKPENILMCEKGYLKIADFGLAVSHDIEEHCDSLQPRKNEFAGTVSYASPEMILKGDDTLTDWWALGVIAYEMFMGHHPFQENLQMPTAEVIMRIVAGPALQTPSDLDPCARELILGLLNNDLENRREFIERIKDCEFFSGVRWAEISSRKSKAPVVDLSILREWKDKFILERKNHAAEKNKIVQKPSLGLQRQRTLDNKDVAEMDGGVLWG
mmetsp:Transcript_5364/g.13078  ORF Transcript_5364/g.13078 Transcript_5364/m.13078 type:complete len:479 (+) Transcript_5364:3-1439(+)